MTNNHLTIVNQNIPAIQDLNAYIRYAMSIPNLSADEERHLLEELHYHKDMSAAKVLILSQLKSVVNIARQFRNYGVPEEDLIQEGNIGLMKAVKNYDISQRVRLYTYAILWIKAEMQSYILKNWKIVKIATTNNLKKLFFNLRSIQQEMIGLGLDKKDVEKYISEKLEVPEEDVKEMTQYFLAGDVPLLLDEQTNDDEKPIYQHQLIDYRTPESEYFQKTNQYDEEEFVKKSLENLTERQQEVISRRYLKEDKMTHKEIAEELGISSERVRQIENEALAKLRKILVEPV